MLLIEYPKCSTCIKAKKWLIANGFDFEDRDIVIDNPKLEELTKWVQDYKIDMNKMFNTSGILYKEMNLKEKLPLMSEQKKLELLSTNGKLVKRPILIRNDFILFGFKEEIWKEKLFH